MWEVIKDWVFDVIQFFYNGVGDWGMAIIIITIIFRVIVAPLVHKSTTANFAMQKVQPLLQEIQTKFADDPVRQREEMQRLYAETKFNPLAGCLPMLIQMPVFIALYQVLYSMVDRMPEGMETVIGENGERLSGGERQRISIARAILKDAPIILMDEATASLDVENESLIQEALSELIKNKTVIVIAHRMRTVRGADKIVLLNQGKIEAMGTDAELQAQSATYRKMLEKSMG